MKRQRLAATPKIGSDDPLPPEVDIPPIARIDLDGLYRTEQPKLLRFLNRITGRDDAQDIVQKVFTRLSAMRPADTAAIASPSAYLREASRNVMIDDARAVVRAGRRIDMPVDDVAFVGADPIAVLEARDRLARLEQAVLRLKPLTREIFLARRLDGFSYAEIAERTGLSVKGVEKQMSRALRQLGRHLHNND